MNNLHSIIGHVDIYQYPDKIAALSHSSLDKIDLVIGDLDGSAIKMLYFLVREDVCTIEPEKYDQLVDIYLTPVEGITRAQLRLFKTIVANLEVSSSNFSIIFLGNDLCDRGMNDYSTLKIYEKLSEKNVDFKIILSNHSAQFLKQFFRGFQIKLFLKMDLDLCPCSNGY
jgi:hypothetical protein